VPAGVTALYQKARHSVVPKHPEKKKKKGLANKTKTDVGVDTIWRHPKRKIVGKTDFHPAVLTL